MEVVWLVSPRALVTSLLFVCRERSIVVRFKNVRIWVFETSANNKLVSQTLLIARSIEESVEFVKPQLAKVNVVATSHLSIARGENSKIALVFFVDVVVVGWNHQVVQS